VLPITARLHSLPLRRLLLHRSVAAQLAIQWGPAEFGLVAHTVAMILVKPVCDLISLLAREGFLRLITPLDDGCLTSARVVAGLPRGLVARCLSVSR
jgi:hypothetical protein